MSIPIDISELKTKLLKPELEGIHKNKHGSTCVNITIRTIHVYDSKTSKKVIEKMRWSIYSLLVFLVIAITIGATLIFVHNTRT